MSTGSDFAEKDRFPANIIEDGPPDRVAKVPDERIQRMSVIPGITEVTDGAIAATETEKRMGIGEGLKLYPKAVGWSILLSTAIIMEGYAIVLLATFYEFPPFKKKFGHLVKDGQYELSAAWQAGLSNGAHVGEILGLFITGIFAERFGYRYTMIGALSLIICFVFILFFAQNVQTLLVGEILCGRFRSSIWKLGDLRLILSIGIPWGVFQTRQLKSRSAPSDSDPRSYDNIRSRSHASTSSLLPHNICQSVMAPLKRTVDESANLPIAAGCWVSLWPLG